MQKNNNNNVPKLGPKTKNKKKHKMWKNCFKM